MLSRSEAVPGTRARFWRAPFLASINASLCLGNCVILHRNGNLCRIIDIVLKFGDEEPVEMLDQLAVEIERCLETTNQIPNLVLLARREHDPGKLHAIEDKLVAIFVHQGSPRKIAIIDGAEALLAVSHLRGQLTNTRVRHFDARHLDVAMKWAGSLDDRPGRLIPLSDISPDIVGFRAEGQITATEYFDTLASTIEERLHARRKLNLLLVFGPEFDSFSEAAIWQDFDFGLRHQGAFEKIAVVTETGAFVHDEKVFAPLCWANIRSFKLSELEMAYTWLGAVAPEVFYGQAE